MNRKSEIVSLGINTTTRRITGAFGILLAFAGFEHGLFESLQGNKPTDGFLIQAIGKSMQWWENGGEEAFTLIPNFLLTGILAMSVSVMIMIWSLFFLRERQDVTILLLLFILLVLVGGGLGFIPYFLITWAYGRNMEGSLSWWERRFSAGARKRWAKFWKPALVVAVISWLIAIEIAIFGWVPGVADPQRALEICWFFLLLTLVSINLTFIAGIANDLERQQRGASFSSDQLFS